MKQAYRVIGRASHPLKPAEEINTVVTSTSEVSAIKKVANKIGIDGAWCVWVGYTVAYPVELADLERAALADWNAGKPTASPLALAQARGEI
jgi:hypothetical protein